MTLKMPNNRSECKYRPLAHSIRWDTLRLRLCEHCAEPVAAKCAKEVGFGKSETRRKFGRDLPHQLATDGAE